MFAPMFLNWFFGLSFEWFCEVLKEVKKKKLDENRISENLNFMEFQKFQKDKLKISNQNVHDSKKKLYTKN
jgi:hypothetical protein